jgi:hypothetical protein
MTRGFRLLATVAVLVASTGSARAGDFCFNSTSPPNPAPHWDPDVLVFAQKFRPPSKGKCREIVGWEGGTTVHADARPVTGMACLNSAGTRLKVGILVHGLGSQFLPSDPLHVRMDLPYPALTDGVVHMHRYSLNPSYELDLTRFDGVAGPCFFGATIPIP